MTFATGLLLAALAGPPAPPEGAGPAEAPVPAPRTEPPPADARRGKRTPRPRATPPPRASRPSVQGELLEVDHRAHRIRLKTSAGEVTLSFDRNTFVLGPGGAGTLVGAAAGQAVRAGHDGAHRATWIELEPAPAPSTPPPAP